MTVEYMVFRLVSIYGFEIEKMKASGSEPSVTSKNTSRVVFLPSFYTCTRNIYLDKLSLTKGEFVIAGLRIRRHGRRIIVKEGNEDAGTILQASLPAIWKIIMELTFLRAQQRIRKWFLMGPPTKVIHNHFFVEPY